jgi:NAD(P)-dependent dehydrogenase (short-subunit alcohol dehydrogenase family)
MPIGSQKRGYDLILVARNGERLGSLAAQLTSETGRSVTSLPADLGDKAALAKVEAVLGDDPSITVLVNNAGRSLPRAALGRGHRQDGGDDHAKCHGASPPCLCRGPRLRRARGRHNRQYFNGGRCRA